MYLLRSSWPRLLELVYWPLMQMLVWGFLQLFLDQQASFLATAGGVLIGALLLWDMLLRGQLGFSISFLEEMWSRNVGNILMSPLRLSELLAGLMAMSVIRLAIGIVPVTILAIVFFGFNIWGLGLAFAAFFANLMLTAWTFGIVVAGLVLRNGLGAEGLAWSLIFPLLPLCAVYYPVETLPAFLEPVAWALPPTYVFEGLRAALIDKVFRGDLMLISFGLNLVYLAAAVFIFFRLVRSARDIGSLMSTGE
ncbi:MAG: ABC transporter permease [Bauldia sp.]|nr:ABC transporter permease [Bauldia sp.]